MKRNHAIFSALFAVSVGAAVVVACSAPDPGEVTYSVNPAKLHDSGIVVQEAAAGGEGGTTGPNTAFTGAPGYQPGSGASTDRDEHMNLFGSTDPAGHNCLDCHSKGGDAGTTFTYGGTVYGADGGPASNVEIRVKEPDGTFAATYSNTEGNFYYLASIGEPIEAGALVGVRNATDVQPMPDPLTGTSAGGCNQAGTCHGDTQGKIHLP